MAESSQRERLRAALPPGSGYRRRRDRVLGRVADAALTARQLAVGLGRELDRAAEEAPRRDVLVLGVYGPEGTEAMAAARRRLASTRHEVRFALGAMSPQPDPALARWTRATAMEGGKFQNLNRLAEGAQPLAADWVLVIDDDVELPRRRFMDRLVCAAEAWRLDLAQPALSRASHGAFEVNRRRPDLLRETAFVEIGPVVLISRRAWRELTPFPELGMGWGLCLHWAALARRRGWRLGVVDATPVRHESRPPAASYDRAAAIEAATDLLASREHIGHAEAERVLAVHPGLP